VSHVSLETGGFFWCKDGPEADSFLTGPHILDDVESLLYLVEFLQEADLPWGWPTMPGDIGSEELKGKKEAWSPQVSPLQEFLAYTRDRR